MAAKSRIIIIAGPQSSGKTTAFNKLKELNPQLTFIEETNQYNVVGQHHLGGAFVTEKLERKILTADLKITKDLYKSKGPFVIETGLFHLVYGEHYFDRKDLGDFTSKYLSLYSKFEPLLLFIDTKPIISWKRRKQHYLLRLKKVKNVREKKRMMDQYRKRLDDIYDLWLKYFNFFPFNKIIIKNSYKSKSQFLTEIIKFVKIYINDHV